MINKILKISVSEDKRDYFPPETRISLFSGEVYKWSGGNAWLGPETTNHPAPVCSLGLWLVTNVLLVKDNMGDNIWRQFGNSPKILFLIPLTAEFCWQKSFSHSVFRLLQSSMMGLVLWCGSSDFCHSRRALTTPSCPSPGRSVPLVVMQGMCPFPGSAVCLWPCCLTWPPLQHQAEGHLVWPPAFPTLSQLLITDPQSTSPQASSSSSHGHLCWPLGSKLAKYLLFAVSWREGKF